MYDLLGKKGAGRGQMFFPQLSCLLRLNAQNQITDTCHPICLFQTDAGSQIITRKRRNQRFLDVCVFLCEHMLLNYKGL